MNINIQDISVHFIGIGGIGMSGIAEILLSLGYKVTGSDISDSANVVRLRELGAQVYIGHNRENITDETTVVVYSSAVNDTNPEMQQARDNQVPIMRRAEMLAELMRLKRGIAIGGTHGKTTTTSFLATILQASNYEPTYIIGGIVSNLAGHAKVGTGEYLVAEADESDGSFLMLNPIMSVVTNIDLDHMDHYGSEDILMASFEEFINKVPFYGLSSLNADDDRLMSLVPFIKKPIVTFGIKNEADYQATNITMDGLSSEFDLIVGPENLGRIKINLPGKHNILNALGAISIAHKMGVPVEMIQSSIRSFENVGRRFQLLYKNDKIEILDDYGHHPTEISSTLGTLKEIRDHKKIAIFEPHRFSRTKDCWNEFLHCFNDVDELYMCPIYPASEEPIAGITSERLVEDINRLHPGLAKNIELKDLDSIIKSNEKATIMTLGAGSIGRVIREWVLDNDRNE
ncbi:MULTISPECIES: UDP-N-acetylmuramate--L-alanine ligase [Halobacteriovorax]|uniref:UDP-N-acetylmuramate--L-alanine ligase n=1 Tax=Halobacteriovorax vibrionivorans TaxID=2152716 RepID=A0ABY0IJN8_9BACT|nr:MULTISPECIES: UDP-N-acetylmuramate--L-alanine ligase [Halobacteriovorax]RZF23138.1 UDP-N-acetylmuramate--L-alanine ligase [Halobacteriovorax vibrionivorans]TGD49230.1 UDP-N-acetylmuramate--L-alanine ligase [Halobacteriovorax sp. Y22]